MELKKYNAPGIFYIPLINAGAVDFEAGVTIAVGDAKVFSDTLILTNISVETVPFTSGSELPVVGATIDGATSGASGTFVAAIITSGTIGAGTAAGALFLSGVSGTFQSENLDINGGTANVMTIGADTTAGLFVELSLGYYVVVLTPAEMTCAAGFISIIDQTSTGEWEDQMIRFETYGNEAALHLMDLDAETDLAVQAMS